MESYVVEVNTPESGRRFLSRLPDIWNPDPGTAHVFHSATEAYHHAVRLSWRDFRPMVVPTSIHPLFRRPIDAS